MRRVAIRSRLDVVTVELVAEPTHQGAETWVANGVNLGAVRNGFGELLDGDKEQLNERKPHAEGSLLSAVLLRSWDNLGGWQVPKALPIDEEVLSVDL